MYRQGYLDPARQRNQFAYYPDPNFAAMSGYTENMKELPVVFWENLKLMKWEQVMGAAGAVMLAVSPMASKKKKYYKKLPLSQRQTLQAAGGIMTLASLVLTYQSL